jgi:hypothetical protein
MDSLSALIATEALVLFLSILSPLNAQMGEPERTLNLRGIEDPSARAIGARLFFTLTNSPPAILTLSNNLATLIKRKAPADPSRQIQVLLGKDLLGWALTEISQLSVPTRSGARKMTFTRIMLTFETDEQAAKTAEALRLASASPKPIAKSIERAKPPSLSNRE